MKRFHFRLRTLFNLKKQQEGVSQANLVRIQADYQKEYHLLTEIQDGLRELTKRRREVRRGLVWRELVCLGELYEMIKKELEYRQIQVVAEVEAELRKCQQELIEIRKERKMLERLRTRFWDAYYREYLREEQRILDEAGSFFCGRIRRKIQ